MKYLISFILLLSLNESFTQEFSTSLFITDRIGNTDTVIIGYDLTASDSIDLSLGEENIAHLPWQKPLEVRCTNIWEDGLFPSHEEIQLKKWVGHLNCEEIQRVQLIKLDILTDNWPVTIRWDSTQFKNECINYSVIADRWISHWFDVSAANNIQYCMGGIGTGLFDRHQSIDADHTRIEPSTSDTIFFVYIGLGNFWNSTIFRYPDYCELTTKTNTHFEDHIAIFQNCIVSHDADDQVNTGYQVYNLQGQELLSGHMKASRHCIDLPKGIYLIELTNGDERVWKYIYQL